MKLKEIYNSILSEQVDAQTFANQLEQEFRKLYPAPTTGTKADMDGIAITLYDDNNTNSFELSAIYIPKSLRGQGIGGELMTRITDYADQVGKIINLTPSTDFGASSVSRLKKFYKQFGFIENKGRKINFQFRGGMLRYPK